MLDRSGAQRQVLHVSGDFPDSIDSSKTPVIRTLLELTKSDFDHRVISLNRRTPPIAGFCWQTLLNFGKPPLEIDREPFEYGAALVYKAPPKGILHAVMLRQLGEYIATHIRKPPKKPDLIVGHKLAIEGIAVRHAAALAGIPYALSIQGDTDLKIIGSRPDLRPELRKVFHQAAVVFPFSPWALDQVEALLGVRTGPKPVLPCPTDIDEPVAPQMNGGGFVSVFHLKNHARKNLQGMVEAARLLEQSGQQVALSVIGGGDTNEMALCQKIAARANSITFDGPMNRKALRARMAKATGFVMPSLRESFGLVFIEALFCGLPIIYPQGTSVDGFFDGAPFALGVDARSASDIAEAMLHIQRNEASIKAELASWQQSNEAKRFTRAAIGKAFRSGLEIALKM